ncbi:MAG: GTPase [Candidatus Heimdallarchaeota archaeon]
MGLQKGWNIVHKLVELAQIVLEVMDARFPHKTRCPRLEQLVTKQGKELILCLNKADLVPRIVVEKWKKKLAREYPVVYTSARDRLGTKILRRLLQQMSRGEKCVVGIAGFPNTGKSSIINILKGHHSAPTAAMPGWTKHSQLYRLTETLMLYDSPGVLPFEGSIEDHALYGGFPIDKLEDPLKLALKLLKKLQNKRPDLLLSHYQVSTSGEQFLADLARIRGRLLPGAIPNIEQVAKEFLRDFVDGKLVYWDDP